MLARNSSLKRAALNLLVCVIVATCHGTAFSQPPGAQPAQPASSSLDALRAQALPSLLAALEELPSRWNKLPKPRIKPTGRSSEQVLNKASEARRQQAVELLVRLSITPDDRVATLIAEAHRNPGIDEVDLWMGERLVGQFVTSDRALAAILVRASLDLAEHMGRRDVLLDAAGSGLQLVRLGLPVKPALALASIWAGIPVPPFGNSGAAQVADEHAELLTLGGKSSESITERRRARRLYRRSGDKIGEANTWQGEGNTRSQLEQHQRALKAFRKARKLYRIHGSKQGEANSWRGEGTVRHSLGQDKLALSAFSKARTLYISLKDSLGEANTWKAEGGVRFVLSENHLALAANERARKLYLAAGNGSGVADTLLADGKVYVQLQEYPRALAVYRAAREGYRLIGSDRGQANTWLWEGLVRRTRGENQLALRASTGAYVLFLLIGERSGQAYALLTEGLVRAQLEEYELALTSYRAAIKVFKAIGDTQGEASTWRHAAEVFGIMGDAREAEKAARRALKLGRSQKPLMNEVNARLALMVSLRQQGRVADAIAQAEKTLNHIGTLRQQAPSEWDRIRKYDTSAPYDLLIPRLARRSKTFLRALAHAEDAHSVVLRDILTTRMNPPKRGSSKTVPEWILTRVSELQRELAILDRALSIATSASRRRLLAERRAADSEMETLLLTTTAYTGEHLSKSKAVKGPSLRKLVEVVGPILMYYVAGNETVVFLLQPGERQPLVHLAKNLGRDELRRRVHDLRNHLSNPLLRDSTTADQLARGLYGQLIQPLSAHIKNEAARLTIIPHGPLHQLPFGALREQRTGKPDRLLLDQWNLTVAPSLSALHTIRARADARKGKPARTFVGLATRANLRHAAAEVREVGSILDAAEDNMLDGSPGREATFARYKSLAGSARYLFLSTHGYQVPGSRSGTYLEIVRSTVHDSRLSIREIATIPIRAELVALSACDTAAGEAMLSDERLDLARAFLIAGADSCAGHALESA